jgi:hypothetical protein
MTNIKIPQTKEPHPLKYVLLNQENAEQFRNLFNSEETKLSLELYGDGEHKDRVEGKIKLWGGRTDNKEDVMKCFSYCPVTVKTY